MKLSVVIAAYNAAVTIGKQLEALASQRWSEPWEVIVVNNRSTDETVAVVERFISRLSGLRIIDAPERPGAAYAINVGVKAARGEAIVFCDADDIVADGWIRAMGEALARHAFISGPFETKKLNTGDLQRHRINPQPHGIQQYTYPPYLPHAASANMGIRRDVFERLGGFDESMAALYDTDLCWRVQLAGIELVAVPEAIVHYRFRGTVTGLLKQAFAYAVYNVLIYKKYRAHGMPKIALKHGIKSWINLVLGVRRLAKAETRVHWLWKAGWLIGRLYASIRYRVMAL